MGLLTQSRFYSVRRDTLTIRGADAAILLVFDAARIQPAPRPWVVDSYATDPGHARRRRSRGRS